MVKRLPYASTLFAKFVNVFAMILDARSRLVPGNRGKAALSILISACNRASSIEHRVSNIAEKTLRNLVNNVVSGVLLFSIAAWAQVVGDPAPDFTYNSVSHGEITLSRYHGTVIYIFFFGYS